MNKIKVVFVFSSGHSGSTLLDLILGSHPDVFGLGELARVENNLPNICGFCGDACEYWKKRVSLPILLKHCSGGKGGQFFLRELQRLDRSIYSHLSEWFGYSNFVDSSKPLSWFKGQMRYKHYKREFTPIFIHMMRDGRAVINSYLRKYPEKGVEKITDEWIQTTRNIQKLYDDYDGPKCRIGYELLALQPDHAIKQICDLLKITYIPDMLNYWNYEHHSIGGNAGTRSLVAKTGKGVKPGAWNKGYYENMGNAIKLDLRWKEELSLESLEVFERKAGELNKAFRHDEA